MRREVADFNMKSGKEKLIATGPHAAYRSVVSAKVAAIVSATLVDFLLANWN
jgi:hypothetical protein